MAPRRNYIECIHSFIEIYCGFQSNNISEVHITWTIFKKNGDVLSVNGDDILTPANGLQWVLDKSYGYTRSPDSRLIVGPFGEDDDHSTYQCSISLPN